MLDEIRRAANAEPFVSIWTDDEDGFFNPSYSGLWISQFASLSFDMILNAGVKFEATRAGNRFSFEAPDRFDLRKHGLDYYTANTPAQLGRLLFASMSDQLAIVQGARTRTEVTAEWCRPYSYRFYGAAGDLKTAHVRQCVYRDARTGTIGTALFNMDPAAAL